MTREEVDQVLTQVEEALDADPKANVAGTGFWKAVGAVKRDPSLVEEFADRIAGIDREAFERWALLTIPPGIGTIVALLATGFGLTFVALAYSADEPWNGLLMLAGMGVLFVATHGLAHLFYGRMVGIQFTHWFVGTIGRPQPGVKTDYVTYLNTPAKARARMHAAGAVVSKIVPLALVPAALIAEVPWWSTAALIATGVIGIVTDYLWSVTKSDWKKYMREMALHRDLEAANSSAD